MLTLHLTTTALVVIDLQKGIMGRALAPHPAEQVTQVTQRLADRFRAAGATIVLVNVAFSKDMKDMPNQLVDQPMQAPPGGFPEGFSDLIDGLAKPGDVHITKRQWGAFHGTELDLQLRRRGVNTVVLGGVATNIGVESTARQAWELGYNLVIVEDITSGHSDEMHNFAFSNIFPRISRVVKSTDLAF